MNKRTFYWSAIILLSSSILLLLLASLLFNLDSDENIQQTVLIYDDNGKILGGAPFPPSLQIPFGTDRDGFHMGDKLLEGAQFTLGAAIVISLLSFVLAFGIGVFGGFTKLKIKALSHKFFTSFYFIPQSIIAYNILYPVIWEPVQGFTTSLTERIIIEIIVLAIIVTPTTAILISNETEQLLGEEFITSAKVLGGSSFFIFLKHVMPHLKMRLFVIYPKIVIQILLVIAHLGFFTLYFGGTDVCYEPFCNPPKPFIQEWSGLMGTNYQELGLSWWIFMAPMLCFAVTILLLNGIAKCIEGLMDTSPHKIERNPHKREEKDENLETSKWPDPFHLINRSGDA
jgi:peptide/nickel transport system permease protein